MPNWCTVHLSMPREVYEAVSSRPGHCAFSLSKIVPPPSDPDRSWCLVHWGTKWDIDENRLWVTDYEDDIAVECETPWSPPEHAIRALSAQFPEAEIVMKFEEPGNRLRGTYKYRSGRIKRWWGAKPRGDVLGLLRVRSGGHPLGGS